MSLMTPTPNRSFGFLALKGLKINRTKAKTKQKELFSVYIL